MNLKENILNKLHDVEYIDFHIHLENNSPFELQNNILYLANSIDRESYNATLALSEMNRNVIVIPGIHPARCQVENWPINLLEQIFSRSVLIGEMGLDFHWIKDRGTDSQQRKVLRDQLKLATKYKSIPSLHTKGAEEEILQLLKDYDIPKSVIHWYSGPVELIPGFLNQGAFFTIGPDIMSGSEIWKHIPAERMFAETDNPTGVPWVKGRDARPDDIVEIYRDLACKMDVTEQDLIDQFKKNLRNLLGN
ncbi:MAG: TatD family hydrolase [Spirochaetales bacterium]|nr:TatD family hydrolase [Spirochaetales bacterium]